MTALFDDLYQPRFDKTFGVPASSPQAVGAGQTGKTITVEATSIEAYRGLDLPAREQAAAWANVEAEMPGSERPAHVPAPPAEQPRAPRRKRKAVTA